jgi:GNAT superfamily N-acetyltransferase
MEEAAFASPATPEPDPEALVFAIRAAAFEDIDALCRLYSDFHEFHVRGVPSRLASLGDAAPAEREALASRLRELIDEPDAALFVASMDGRLVGFAEAYVRDDPPTPYRVARRHGHLQSMFVAGDRRDAGIGRALLDACESWAKSRDAVEMRLDVWEFAKGPLRFYERAGYRTIRRGLARDLE